MKYNFDEVIERRGTDSVKYDAVSERWGRSDLLPAGHQLNKPELCGIR